MVLCEENVGRPLHFSSHSSDYLHIVVYNYATVDSEFNVSVSTTDTFCPGYNVHCCTKRDLSTREAISQISPVNKYNGHGWP